MPGYVCVRIAGHAGPHVFERRLGGSSGRQPLTFGLSERAFDGPAEPSPVDVDQRR